MVATSFEVESNMSEVMSTNKKPRYDLLFQIDQRHESMIDSLQQ